MMSLPISRLCSRRRPLFQRLASSLASSCSAPHTHTHVAVGSSAAQQFRRQLHPHRRPPSPSPPPRFQPPSSMAPTTQRQFASKSRRHHKKKTDANAPLLNEHLIAELFRHKKQDVAVTADTYEVRLIVDRGWTAANTEGDGNGADAAEEDAAEEDAVPATHVTTIASAISLAHQLGLDLMEVTLHSDPPVVKAVDFDRWLYARERRERKAAAEKRREGGGAISDRPLKEFKFKAGIADHDLARKANNMIGYLARGHAIRVTLTARRWRLVADEGAISTTLDRVRELLGDRAVEARGMKANDRKSFGSLLLHPNKSSKA